jgi:hypothetical protein
LGCTLRELRSIYLIVVAAVWLVGLGTLSYSPGCLGSIPPWARFWESKCNPPSDLNVVSAFRVPAVVLWMAVSRSKAWDHSFGI